MIDIYIYSIIRIIHHNVFSNLRDINKYYFARH